MSNNIDYRLQNCADGAAVLIEIPSDGSTEVEVPISCDILYFCVQSVFLQNLNLNDFFFNGGIATNKLNIGQGVT